MLISAITWDKLFEDWLYTKWLIMILICAGIMLAPLWKKSKVLYTYLAWSILCGMIPFYFDYLDKNHVLLKIRARPDILFYTMALLLGIAFMYKVNVNKFSKFLSVLFYLNVGLTIVHAILMKCGIHIIDIGVDTFTLRAGWVGIYNNCSLSGTLLALLFTFRLRDLYLKLSSIKLGVIFFTDFILAATCFALYKTSMGVAAFMAGVYVVLILNDNSKKFKVGLTLFMISIVGVLYWQQGVELFTPTERLDDWEKVWFLVTKSGWYWLVKGYGYGSYTAISLLLFIKDLAAGKVVSMHMHNDYLQTVFETGWVGLTLWIVLLVDMLRRAFLNKNYWVLYFIVAWGISGLGNFPKYLAIEHFMFFLILKEVYFTDKGEL